MQVPQVIPLVEAAPGMYHVAGMPQWMTERVIRFGSPGWHTLWQLDKVYVDSLGLERCVYEIVGFVSSLGEAYSWLVGVGDA